METIRVHSDFHAAHRQLGYPGKCRHVHGHTWHGTIVVSAESFPRDDLEMSVDFGDLKDVLRKMDHRMLVSEDDKVFTSGQYFEPEGIVVIPGHNPSVENVAQYCIREVIGLLRNKYPDRGITYHVEVTIQETENNIFTAAAAATI